MMDKYHYILAGLLHDIGKFWQRADVNKGALQKSKGMENTICPLTNGGYGYRHVLYTDEFCETYLKTANFPLCHLNAADITNLASYHHRPSTKEQKIIQEADHLSAGMEREDEEIDPHSKDRFRKTRLRPVAAEIDLRKGTTGGYHQIKPLSLFVELLKQWIQFLTTGGYHQIKPLSPDVAFPSNDLTENRDLTEEYRELWNKFTKEWCENKVEDPWGFIARALSILERYTWCIPSATNVKVPDISLFDHLKTTAAIAGCLADDKADKDYPMLLVAGDMGGIQDYIFGIRKGAGGLSRRLRSRSFYVSVFVDSIAHQLLHAAEYPLTNLILSSGGKFHLLLPNSKLIKDELDKAKREIEEWALEEMSGEIRLNMAWVPIKKQFDEKKRRIDLKDFTSIMAEANDKLRDEKSRPLTSVLQSGNRWNEGKFVKKQEKPDEDGLCDSCQKNFGPLRRVREDQDDQKAYVCDNCHDDGQDGQKLPRIKYIAYYYDKAGKRPLPIGSFSLVEDLEDLKKIKPYLIIDLDGEATGPEDLPLMTGWRTRHVPQDDEGKTLPFDKLIERSEGREALAYLKLDVDNLGYIFSNGLKGKGKEPDRTSISRVSTLSRMLELFFSGYVQQLLKKEFKDIYTVYVGGDDALCVGPWVNVFDFAVRLRKEFRRFTANNPAWTISAGIAMVGVKIPVLNAVEDAERRLEASKHIVEDGVLPWPCEQPTAIWELTLAGILPTYPKHTKNRITAFETSIPWDNFPEILRKAKEVLGWLKDDTLNTAQVYRLLQYSRLYRQYQRTTDTASLRYVPMLVYDLKRNWKEGSESKKKAKEWAQSLACPEAEDLKILHFICEYALYGNRGSTKEV